MEGFGIDTYAPLPDEGDGSGEGHIPETTTPLNSEALAVFRERVTRIVATDEWDEGPICMRWMFFIFSRDSDLTRNIVVLSLAYLKRFCMLSLVNLHLRLYYTFICNTACA